MHGYTVSPLDLRLEAERADRESRAQARRAEENRATADRLECPRCTVMIDIPVDASGALVLARAFATHELLCPA
jgi:hypothetical protein